MRYLILGVFLSALSLVPCRPAQAGEAPIELWDRLYLAGAHAGYVHTVQKTVGAEGERYVETRVETDMTMNRLGATTHIHTISETTETPEGALRRIVSTTKMSANVTRSTFTFRAGRVAIETEVMGKTRTVEVDVEKDLTGPAFMGRALQQLAGTEGKKVGIKSYMADFQRVVLTTFTSRGEESTAWYDDSQVKLTRVDAELSDLPAFRPVSWIDAEGNVLKTAITLSGMAFQTYRVAGEAEARAKEGRGPAPDVFAATLVTERDPIPVPRQLEAATIVLKRKDETLAFPTFQAQGLTVAPGEDGSITLEVQRVVPPADKQGRRPLETVPADLADALAASSMIQVDAPAIAEAAQTVVGQETNAWKAAQKLERWVFETMTQKNFNVAFASALEALETQEGDCTEHAVLLAALCRAAGIPARVVMGVEYLAGIWGGHAWNDVWIDGAWYALDGTNGYGFVDPLHLPMAHMVMKEGAASEFSQILGGIGNLDVDIVSVQRDGRAIRVNDVAKLVRTEGGRYTDRIWGLRFDAPEGFVFDPPSRRKGMSMKLMELDGKTAEGKTVEIRVDAMDAPAGDAIGSILQQMKVDPKWVSTTAVDERPARTVTMTGSGRTVLRTLVVADKALYIFTIDRASGEAERKAFEQLLASVDFDLDPE